MTESPDAIHAAVLRVLKAPHICDVFFCSTRSRRPGLCEKHDRELMAAVDLLEVELLALLELENGVTD